MQLSTVYSVYCVYVASVCLRTTMFGKIYPLVKMHAFVGGWLGLGIGVQTYTHNMALYIPNGTKVWTQKDQFVREENEQILIWLFCTVS